MTPFCFGSTYVRVGNTVQLYFHMWVKLKEKVREEETRALLLFLLKRQCGILGGMQVLGTTLILFFHFNYLFDNYFPFINHRFFCMCFIACFFPQAYIVFPQSPHLLQFFSAFIITLLSHVSVGWLALLGSFSALQCISLCCSWQGAWWCWSSQMDFSGVWRLVLTCLGAQPGLLTRMP